MKTNINDIITAAQNSIETSKHRSAWQKGVNEYAVDLLETIRGAVEGGWMDAEDLGSPKLVERAMLNGASDWSEYSWGGCAMIYDADIAKTLCTPSELKRTDNGRKRPNANEEWLDTQARALFQASIVAKKALQDAL